MEISEEVRATHQELSVASLHFLEYVQANPECSQRFEFDTTNTPEILEYYPVQPWPTFVGPRKLREIERATRGVAKLVRDIPFRLLGGDPRKLTEFYGFENPELASTFFSPPNGIDGMLGRCDLVDSKRGLKCLEVNLGGLIGGIEIRFLAQACLENPPIARFLEGQPFEARYRDPLDSLLSHILEDTMCSGVCEGQELNIAIVLDHEHYLISRGLCDSFNSVYEALQKEKYLGVVGEVVMCEYPSGLMVDPTGRLSHQGMAVHAVVECTVVSTTPTEVMRCFKSRSITLYGGPLPVAMSNKRSLAVLSMSEELDIFSSEEKELIRQHVPWTRDVVAGEASYYGEAVSVLEHLEEHRGDFVLKPGASARGERVHVGRFTSREEWRERLRTAVDEGEWIAQEYVESRPYIYQQGDMGHCPHDVVWGTFCFGNTYGGGFLRMIPKKSTNGVVNSIRGATEGIFFEV